MSRLSQDGEEFLRRVDGLMVGQLDDEEMAAFNRLVAAGFAFRSYEGAVGFLGCATARRVPTPPPLEQRVLEDAR